MFLAVIAKLRPEYSFDGKVGIWSFTRLRKAKRSVKKTGTVAGETDILESVSVTAEEYRHVVLKRGGVFDTLRQKMWWFARDADTRTPEAGCTLFYQHDGASPHTARANCNGAKKFKIEVITQPPQSPDLNVNDLAFFSSLQSDCELVAKETAIELKEAVEIASRNTQPTEWQKSGIVSLRLSRGSWNQRETTHTLTTSAADMPIISLPRRESTMTAAFRCKTSRKQRSHWSSYAMKSTQTQNAKSMQLRAHQTTMSELHPKFVHNLKSIF